MLQRSIHVVQPQRRQRRYVTVTAFGGPCSERELRARRQRRKGDPQQRALKPVVAEGTNVIRH